MDHTSHGPNRVVAETRVVIVDDDLFVRTTLARELDSANGIVVVGVYADGGEAVSRVRADRPDVALVDISMPGLDGTATTRQLRDRSPSVRVLALTSIMDATAASAMLQAGAVGFLPKDLPLDAIVHAIGAARHGLAVLAGPSTELIGHSEPADLASMLSDTERAILQRIGAGLTTDQIATEIYLSSSTVKYHVTNLMQKLGATNRVTLAVRAHELGIRS